MRVIADHTGGQRTQFAPKKCNFLRMPANKHGMWKNMQVHCKMMGPKNYCAMNVEFVHQQQTNRVEWNKRIVALFITEIYTGQLRGYYTIIGRPSYPW